MKRLTKKQKAKNRANYNRIRKAYEKTDKSVSYIEFKRIVMGRSKGTGETIGEAAKNTAHSYAFTSAEQIGKENLLAGLKKEFPDTYKELKSKMGRFDKGDKMIDRLSWDKDKQMYKFSSSTGQTYYVDISNSPKQAFII
jgi:hypothetical protein